MMVAHRSFVEEKLVLPKLVGEIELPFARRINFQREFTLRARCRE